jgi:molybdopterin-binding protein
MATKEVILKVERLVKRWGNFVLEIPSLEFQKGEIYALVGPNGAGKTTLLHLLSGLERVDAGKILFKTREITQPHPKIALVMENPYLFHTSVLKNVLAGLKFHRFPRSIWHAKAEEGLRSVGLEGFTHHSANHLSRGQTQRVAIARVLVVEPEILLLDEPFTNIDKMSLEGIENLLKELNTQRKLTIIFSTHDLAQAYRVAREVISLVNGKINPSSPENFFLVEIENVNGLKKAKLAPSVVVEIATSKIGKAYLSIPPESIILSRQSFPSSVRNSFLGRIKTIELSSETARVGVDIGVTLSVRVTKKSFEELKLGNGGEVFLTFKSTALKVF